MKVSFADFDLPNQLNSALEKIQEFLSQHLFSLKSFFANYVWKRRNGNCSKPGTGKTLAYLLPVLKTWKYNKTEVQLYFILVPTRELVVQVAEVVEKLTEDMSTRGF